MGSASKASSPEGGYPGKHPRSSVAFVPLESFEYLTCSCQPRVFPAQRVLTEDLQVDRLYPILQDCYDMWQLFSDLADVGHNGAARPRTYVIFARKDRILLRDPISLYEKIADGIAQTISTEPHHYMTATDLEIDLDAAEVARCRGVPHIPGEQNLTYLLNKRERRAVDDLSLEHILRWQRTPASDENLCFYLGDDPKFARTWSAVSKKVPTLRRGSSSGKMWFPARCRWMTPAEKPLGLKQVRARHVEHFSLCLLAQVVLPVCARSVERGRCDGD